MDAAIDRDQLIKLVEKILQGTEPLENLEAYLHLVEQYVPDPNVSDLIYWPSENGLGEDPSAEEIIDKAFRYKPIAL